METITFSQASLLTFLKCRRRFQLRYLDRLSWPDLPFLPQQREAIEQGQRFHQLLERVFLGLPVEELDLTDSQLQIWWRRFEENVLPLPSGRALAELRLTVAISDHFLNGRFDLVIVGNESGNPIVHIFDWKTSRPRSVVELEESWQSKLYLAMLAESGTALVNGREILRPEQIELTYWYVSDPQSPRTITYSQEKHAHNWAEIESLVNEIDACLKQDYWPLTDNWSHCRSCTYGTYCGRFETGAVEHIIAEEEVAYAFETEYAFDDIFLIEPESP